ncbi:PQQ-dependent sugar dehydrogenase [Sediminicoccus rosea]|jgi:glucose/arabinose dehydrogenase|uniref:PQQ-dependent sugar dehydrogenase n=1 Tax=Sediminicoccus rosea TaxID=1225128 RepID=A0ABZ0PJQ8_9PROT|nr:PQQ-dependent sugar dehydrogenase [Sediminicoccus rosea]WPB85691.1 PQQ-dependent sugar dehydrogenase [Sediminicoccus rosea]
MTIRRNLLGMAALLMAGPAFAQAPAATPAPVPGWAVGRPEGSTLAPHAARLTVTPLDQVPVSSIRLPQGFQAEVFAHGIPGVRAIAEAPGGTLFAGTRAIGRVYAITRNPDGTTRTRIFAQGLAQPNGLVMIGNSLYIFAVNRVLRYDNVEANLDNPPAPVDLTAAFALPTEQEHGGNHHWKYASLGPDGRIYTNVGVNCNVCDTDRDKFALLVSFRPDGSDRRIEARGVRNSVGFAHHPTTRELWATNHGRDWVGDDNPQDSLLRVRRAGEDFGFPYCLGTWADPQYNRGRACSEFSQPAALLGPHTAVLGMRFYTGTMFPEQYRNQIFIARRGSWNRSRLSGYDVVVAHLDAQGNVTRVEEFLTGFRDDANQRFADRPAEVHVLRDGSMLVSGEQMGAIYRITYRR